VISRPYLSFRHVFLFSIRYQSNLKNVYIMKNLGTYAKVLAVNLNFALLPVPVMFWSARRFNKFTDNMSWLIRWQHLSYCVNDFKHIVNCLSALLVKVPNKSLFTCEEWILVKTASKFQVPFVKVWICLLSLLVRRKVPKRVSICVFYNQTVVLHSVGLLR
jgi:hypothetical protein